MPPPTPLAVVWPVVASAAAAIVIEAVVLTLAAIVVEAVVPALAAIVIEPIVPALAAIVIETVVASMVAHLVLALLMVGRIIAAALCLGNCRNGDRTRECERSQRFRKAGVHVCRPPVGLHVRLKDAAAPVLIAIGPWSRHARVHHDVPSGTT